MLIVLAAIFPEQQLTNGKKGRALTLALTLGIKKNDTGRAEALAKGAVRLFPGAPAVFN